METEFSEQRSVNPTSTTGWLLLRALVLIPRASNSIQAIPWFALASFMRNAASTRKGSKYAGDLRAAVNRANLTWKAAAGLWA